jgi:3-dehydroquinate synthase
MNYGHSYGHAIEAATDFAIPHGIAVTLGMDMANFQSYKMNRIDSFDFLKWHSCLLKNYKDYLGTNINLNLFLSALNKDKKNSTTHLNLILVKKNSAIEKIPVLADETFSNNCSEFLEKYFISGGKS